MASMLFETEAERIARPSEIRFTVFGKAATSGSGRPVPIRDKHGNVVTTRVVDSCKAAPAWKHEVASVGQESYTGPLLTGALEVEFRFFIPRTKGHYGSGRNADRVKDSAPKHPTTRPDVLKRARAVEDALTGVIWSDDAQIVSEHIFKEWGSPQRVEIIIRLLD